jgi:two-component system chemotaxis response regulator CheB
MGHRDVVVLGASAGGVVALQQVLRDLPGHLAAAVFVVLHMPANGPGPLARILGLHSALPVHDAVDGERVRLGCVYVARPDRHLVVERDRVRVIDGPKQNRARPSVDALFQAAAAAFGPRVVGVVLTGSLDDGTAGLRAIKDGGGLAIVQDPLDAEFRGMPRSAADGVDVDHKVPLAAIAATIAAAVAERVAASPRGPRPH